MFKKMISAFKRKKVFSIEKERIQYNEKFHFSYGFRVNDDKKIDAIKDIYLFLKKEKNLESFYFIGQSHHKNQACPLDVYPKLLSSLQKLDSKAHSSFIKYGFQGVLELSKKSNYSNFDHLYSKVEKLYFTSFKLPLVERQKVIEFTKYLIKTEKLKTISLKQIDREVERIVAGLLQTKITSSLKRKSCDDTYGGFLRVLSSNTAYFVNINNNLYVVKSQIGKHPEYEGYKKLALDLRTLNVHGFETINGKNIVGEKALEFFYLYKTPLNLAIASSFEKLKENYIKYYQNRNFKNEEQRKKAINRIQEIFSKENVSKILKRWCKCIKTQRFL